MTYIGFSEYLVLPVHVKEAPFTVKKNLPEVEVGGKATAVMPHGGGGGEGHWSMDNSPTPPQVGRVGLIIDRCIRRTTLWFFGFFAYTAYQCTCYQLPSWLARK